MTTPHLTILTGASRGMGLGLARQLLSPNHVLLCLSRQISDELQAEAERLGAPLTQWSQDLADTGGARDRLSNWLTGLNPKEIASATLINNAGVLPAIVPLPDCPPEQLTNALRVGLEAPMHLTAAFLGATRAWVKAGWKGPRRVLNISSGLGRNAMASQAPYCAAKAGLDHFTRCCALEELHQPHGAKLVSLAPGVIDTDMQIHLRGSEAQGFPDRQRFVDLREKGMLSSPEDAATRVLAWLDRSDFGQNPVADVRDA
jgi:benzil reductase ((S)-benzoin forming)